MAIKKRPPRDPSKGEVDTTPQKGEVEAVESKVELPIKESMSLERRAGGWFVMVYKTQGDKVVEVEKIGPDCKMVMVERYKIMFVRKFISE